MGPDCEECSLCGCCHCSDCDNECIECAQCGDTRCKGRCAFRSPPRAEVTPGNPGAIELTRLEDGSPLVRIGNQCGIGLDFDTPLASIPAAAIGWVRTQRGHHVLLGPMDDQEARAAAVQADPGHLQASIEGGSWDLRVLDKDTLQPRVLHRHGRARIAGSMEAAAFDAIAAVWIQGGGLVEQEPVAAPDNPTSANPHSLRLAQVVAEVLSEKGITGVRTMIGSHLRAKMLTEEEAHTLYDAANVRLREIRSSGNGALS